MSNFKQFAQDFGKKVVEIRKKQRLNQDELADKAGIERSYMGAIERGERNPTIKKVYQVSKALDIKASELFS